MIAHERLDSLVLARLSVGTKTPPSLMDLTKSLYPFVSRYIVASQWQNEVDGALQRLRSAGLVERQALRLTAAGQARLASTLGLGAPVSTRNWAQFKKLHLRGLLGHSAGGGRAEPPLVRGVVAKALGVPQAAATTDAALANTWLSESLSLRGGPVTFGAVKAALLAQKLGVPARRTVKEVLRLAAPKVVGATSANSDDMVRALAYEWLTRGSEHDAEPEPPAQSNTGSADVLVHKIRAAANSPDAKHFGANKVFIGSVWQRLQSDPEMQPLGEAGFKRLLVEAHQRGELTLSRADLVAAMDPGDVAASETQHLNATYHFIQVTGGQP